MLAFLLCALSITSSDDFLPYYAQHVQAARQRKRLALKLGHPVILKPSTLPKMLPSDPLYILVVIFPQIFHGWMRLIGINVDKELPRYEIKDSA